MKRTIQQLTRGILLVPVLVLGLGFTFAPAASAECNTDSLNLSSGVDCAKGDKTPDSLFGGNGNEGIFKKIVNILLFVIGAVAVIMLIIGGIRYVTSAGDQNAVTAAKNTIMYAIIGIVVAVLAFAVVNFVLQGLIPNGG